MIETSKPIQRRKVKPPPVKMTTLKPKANQLNWCQRPQFTHENRNTEISQQAVNRIIKVVKLVS